MPFAFKFVGAQLSWSVHLAEPGNVPKFGREITAFFDLLFIKADVLAARRDPHQAEAQPVRAIFVDQVEGIGGIA